MIRYVCGIAIACTLATTSAAQPAPPPPSQATVQDPKLQARKLFDEATEHYKLGRFAVALEGYESAYALFKAPAFLFNIAQCHFQLRNWDRAAFFFEGYLREQPDATNRALVEDLIREAREREAASRTDEQRKLDLDKARRELERKEQERLAAERERNRLAVQVRDQPAPIYKKWWFWTAVGGVAIASVATTVAFATRDTVLPSGSLGTVDQR
jgi:tetratricopeptide (TPR) repeat protein